MAERYALLVVGDAGVDHLGVAGTEDTLADLEEELGLGGIVHCYARPLRFAILVVDERAGEDMLELSCDGGALDDLLEAGGVDIMLDLHSVGLPVGVDHPEPFPHALVQFDVLAELLELLATQGYVILLRLVEHQFHVREDIAGILAGSEFVGHLPESFGSGLHGLDEAEFLHIARREGSVKVID